MVGHGEGPHTEFLGPCDQTVDSAGPVEQAVIGVNVKMNEFGVFACHPTTPNPEKMSFNRNPDPWLFSDDGQRLTGKNFAAAFRTEMVGVPIGPS
jgi:hypothetical protein